MSNKALFRLSLKKRRDAIAHSRREEAKLSLLELIPHLASFRSILSFASFGSEIDTSLLNLFLADTQRLCLPKVFGNSLKIFHVNQLESQLSHHSFGMLEPNPEQCTEVEVSKIDVVLVPALGFDAENHRLGYGKGYYDRFLQYTPSVLTIGIGFHEQYVPILPISITDIPLKKVCLF